METDIGNPIEYNPTLDPLNHGKEEDNKEELVQDQPYYFHPSEMNYPQSPPQNEKFDLFNNVDKSTWIIAFAVFLLGFFMGKTMQPVILRYT
jgi:hypothetical protein